MWVNLSGCSKKQWEFQTVSKVSLWNICWTIFVVVIPSNADTSKCINFRLYIIVFSSWFPPNILGLKRLVFHPLNHGSEFDPMKSKAKAEHVTPLQWSWCCFPWLPVSPAIPWFSKVFYVQPQCLAWPKNTKQESKCGLQRFPEKMAVWPMQCGPKV